jgi:serine/threonine protein kinase
MSSFARDIFLSHSSGDAEVARELRAALEAAGYTCWMAPDDVDGTEPWAEQILAAINGTRAMVVLISTNANRSAHVSREVNLALGRKRAVLPIRIENVAPEASLEYLLSLVQRVDAFPPPIADHHERILRRLRVIVPLADASTAIAPASIDMPAPPQTQPIPESIVEAEPAVPHETVVVGPGARVGPFTIESVLGQGGMATVYRATQEEPRRAVALKVVRADHASDAGYRERFLAEKDTLAALEHPSIVPIYAAGESNGVLFIAMRLIDGPDLAARLAATGPMSLRDTVDTLRPIADAVDHAHESGVIHRDLKPSNVILDRRGRPYLTDFGLGKSVDRPRDLSVTGIALGTLDYMAPEQFSGPIEPALANRIDVYALGCLAYACLTGKPPFRAAGPQQVMYGHLEGPVPSVHQLRPDLPPAVDVAIGRALAKKPVDRYSTAGEFLRTLTAAADVSEQHTVPVVVPVRPGLRGVRSWARANSALAGGVVALAALVALGGGALALRPTADETTQPAGSRGAAASVGPTQRIGGETSLIPSSAPSPAQPSPGDPPVTPGPPTAAPPDDDPTPDPPDPLPPQPTRDETPPTGGSVRINRNDLYTTSGSVTVRVTAKPVDRQSGIAAYVWSTSSVRPSSGVKAYAEKFTATISTSTRATRSIFVWFRNGDGVWTTSPVKDSIIFDHQPKRASDCPSSLDINAAGYHLSYMVWIRTTCFTDSDGDALTIYAAQPGTGSIGSAQPSDCGGAARTCWWYYPPSGWSGNSLQTSFTIWAEDDLGAKSGTIRFDLCVNC